MEKCEVAFAVRLRGFGEQLVNGTRRLCREQDVKFVTRWFPDLHRLSERDPVSVTTLAVEAGHRNRSKPVKSDLHL
ncbi:MAG: hypothetical protein OEW00_14065 [candidate division Zixibacteria bacterium]|nr:hypothetical protein [candidate division Zixibacteria bacterium]